MKSVFNIGLLAAALCCASVSLAQAPADAPAGTNGICNDGTYSQSAHKQGACRGHKGVKEWYATDAGSSSSGGASATSTSTPASTASKSTNSPPPAAAAPAAPATAPTPAPAASSSKSSSFTPPANAAPGGGPGMVWVNTSSKVYHCPSDQWYGKTKHGAYMSESDAIAKGNRPDHGKACK